MKKLARRSTLLGIVAAGVAQVEKHFAALAVSLELGGDFVYAGLGELAGLEIKDGGVF